MITAEIIAVGSELLTPFRMDTNSLWLTEQLNKYGITITRKHIIGDDKSALIDLLQQAGKRSRLVLVSGGLGPTFDDITRDALADALNLQLIYHDKIFQLIEKLFIKRKRKITENNRRQAYVPEGGAFYLNPVGTAPGLLVRSETCAYALLPGPPSELKAVFLRMEKDLIPGKARPVVHTRVFKLVNVPESQADQRLRTLRMPDNADWSILASYGQVEVHVRINSSNQKEVETFFNEIEDEVKKRMEHHYFGKDDATLESTVGDLLASHKHTLSIAESCTGGWLSERITSVSGSSTYFLMGIVSYSNEAKMQLLSVSEDTLIKYGAVSRQTALEMAKGIMQKSGSDVSIAITGIAGPTGGTGEKPVGTVYIAAIAADGNETCHRFLFSGAREKIRYLATQSALDIIRLQYLGVSLDSAFTVVEQEDRGDK